MYTGTSGTGLSIAGHQSNIKTMVLSSALHEFSNRAPIYNVNLTDRISRDWRREPQRGSTAVVYQGLEGTLTPDGTKVAIKTFPRTLSGSTL